MINAPATHARSAREPPVSALLRFADCELDLAAFELRRAGRPCAVEPQVFELLAYLAANPGRLVTKDELIAQVWGGRIVSDAALASRIKSARKAIGDDGEQQRLIRTVHGRGIRFTAEPVQGEAVPPVPPAAQAPAKLHQDIRFCTARDGVRLAYATVGAGPPLVKPAHWMSHLEYDWESPVWRPWLHACARDHTLIRYDERANGLSDWEAADLSLEAHVADLEAVVAAAGVERFPLFCMSQGCALGVTYAVRHPERVSRLVIYGGYARGWAKRGDQAEIVRRSALGALIEHGWGQDNPAFRQIFTTRFMPEGSPDQAHWLNDLQRMTASPVNARRLHDAFGEVDVRALLPQVRAPTLVLHTRDDGAVPFSEGRLLAAEIPGARFVPLEGRNHLLIETEPAWQQCFAAIRAFLAEA
jgi:pimeloyl-ACP methyl ester carboxylesterase/DNA-binding winged helix-turn-helix (wHTH) protein